MHKILSIKYTFVRISQQKTPKAGHGTAAPALCEAAVVRNYLLRRPFVFLTII
nr:MAG TPA: hypothetical protein [Caudoviricetes sp.]